VWLKFAGSANGRAYFGFGASATGTLSLVAAPNTGQLILQQNVGYGFTDLAAVSMSYQANHWYRLEVAWGKSGTIVGKLFDSNGTTLLQSVTAATTAITSGGIAFRATGNDKYFDTVTDTAGVNNFVVQAGGNSGVKQGGRDDDRGRRRAKVGRRCRRRRARRRRVRLGISSWRGRPRCCRNWTRCLRRWDRMRGCSRPSDRPGR